jgi:hypothetical protein
MPSLSQAFTTQHSNVFILILFLSEGRPGIAWVLCNKMLFLPQKLSVSRFSPKCSLYVYSCTRTILPDSHAKIISAVEG